MWHYVGLAFVALALLLTVQSIVDFRRNLAAAKASGLPYICIPIYTFNPVWLLVLVLSSFFEGWVPQSMVPEFVR